MNRQELECLLNDIAAARIAVIGDYCLDAYWFIDPAGGELSVETGLETRAVREQRYSLGGAGNVVMNLCAMGVKEVSAFGVIGDDPYGQHMLRLLREQRVAVDGIVMQRDHWATHVYTKPYVHDAEQNRIDFGNFNELGDETAAELVQALKARIAAVDAVIVNEQVASGIHRSPRFQQLLKAVMAACPAMVFVLDSRHYSEGYDGTIRKLNDHEAARLCGIRRAPDELVLLSEARAAAETLGKRWGTPVVVTRGARGCLVRDATGVQEIPGLQILGRVDPVGAGDSMLAGFAAALAAGREVLKAATLGNFAAGVTVQKLFQTGTASPAEILAIGGDPDYIYRPELAEDMRQARFIDGTEFELVTERPRGIPFTHVILDHDGTISSLRQGWEEIMEPMMIRAVLGPRFDDADESLYQKVVHTVRDYIDKTTGIQTIQQMEGLVAMVKDFGCVPGAEVLDAAGYKGIYNKALMHLVNQRIAKFRRGELDVADYTLKNAAAFLETLHATGLTLYLASGTDEADVIAEATALGYARFFAGHIHGSRGSTSHDAKKVVLERILNDVGREHAKHLLAIGDGPVEIRETHKRGGYCIGIASDEVRRFGLNAAKRSRLIRAGADLIIPDYSQLTALLELLGIAAR